MELDELTETRLLVVALAIIVLFVWALRAAGNRRQQARFAALAQSFGAAATRQGPFLSRFAAEVAGRTFDVRYQHIGKGVGVGGWAPGWYVVSETPLQGVSELYSAEIRPRGGRPRQVQPGDPEWSRYFDVRDAGYPLRKGWLSERMRVAIADFYALELRPEPLVLEEGHLLHRAHGPLRRFESANLRELISRQAAVAAELESAL